MTARQVDLVLRVISGPGASVTPVELRGPRVVVGGDPPPGGLRLPLGRGVADEHCTITAYDPTSAVLRALGDHPVRVAPYAGVRWDDLEPVRGRVRLERGTVVHLGPTGQRGVTIEFLGCRDLGDELAARLVSDGADVVIVGARAPDSIAARARRPSVRTLVADGLGSGALRWWALGLFGSSAVLLMVAALLVLVGRSEPAEQPRDDGWRLTVVDDVDVVDHGLARHTGFAAPLHDFLFAPDAELAGVDVAGLDPADPTTWDPRLVAAIVKHTRAVAKPWYFRRYDEIEPSFRAVVEQLDAAGLPLVLAGIPMHESCYNAAAVSPVCAYGWWQLMPEFGFRYRDEGFVVADCRYRDGKPGTYTPAQVAPPGKVRLNAPYYDAEGERCALRLPCGTDFRGDLARSTAVAARSLGDVLREPEARASGAAVQITIASHHAGWDDEALLGTSYGKKWNLRRALGSWTAHRAATEAKATAAGVPSDVPPVAHFFGDAMRCTRKGQDDAGCAAYLNPDTQTYVPAVVSSFLLGVCYYARNADAFGWDGARDRWARYLGEGGFCRELDVPTREEVRALRFDPTVRWCRRS